MSGLTPAALAEARRLASEATPESLARLFHETYERLAPSFGYETREASAVPWEDVPEPNKSLMVAVAGEVFAHCNPAFVLELVREVERLARVEEAAKHARNRLLGNIGREEVAAGLYAALANPAAEAEA